MCILKDIISRNISDGHGIRLGGYTARCRAAKKDPCGVRRSVVSNSSQPHDCGPPGSSVPGILEAGILG